MGNTPSNLSYKEEEDIWWRNGVIEKGIPEQVASNPKDSFHNFAEEFDRKRDKRKQILEQKRKEIQGIREELDILRKENEKLRNQQSNQQNTQENEELAFLRRQNQSLREEILEIRQREESVEDIREKNTQLRISVSEMQSELQKMNSSLLDFEEQREDYKRHVVALKDVIKVSKELLQIRETELKDLKEKLKSIEIAFNEREASLMSNDLKKEYEKQLQNIRNLRELYEERSRTHKRETSLLKSNLEDKEKELEKSEQKMSELEQRIQDLEKDNSDKYDTIKSLESNLGLVKAETRQYQAELAVINQLFSHILLAFHNSPELDFDKLLKRLEENHDLLKDIVNNEVSSEVSSALPKVLLDLVNQISGENEPSENENCDKKKALTETETPSTSYNLNSPAEIAENLPKVWRVLIELLSHQSAKVSDQTTNDEEDENRCYKTVTTPKGPSSVLSVSKTFFRLKELIVEKKTLEKDMNNLKQLNSHLESRLQEQEKRFEFVSTELSKTWNFVGKLQKEHKLLHTQEQILRYELAQKRKLLKELKEELEYSREKWQQAREKNSKTEKEWLILRKEFAARRRTIVEDGNNSVESGFSDEREGSSDEEPGYETDISECNGKVDETCEDELSEEIEHDNKVEENKEDKSLPTPNNNVQEVPILEDISTVDPEETESRNEGSFEVPQDLDDQTENAFEKPEESDLSSITNLEKGLSTKKEADATLASSKDKHSVANEDIPINSGATSTKSFEERLAARDERLKRLEGQCKALVSQVTNTSNRSNAICTKLEDLHEIYGECSRDSHSRNPTEELGTKGSDEEKEEES
ncbi:intracellular protein transport protein USO1 [Harmonia axyridis]|uniref:intracellular protein transport protein USO1 n=1 Tax=Harmonia axyridis TaxID=115357 RepID=UPI001E279417|nr:intracellular protein transport protein USO1 [Harmonia axyridis]XP_045464641.1 intracellular protein transport protein USO1 [Harmonia axyridis]XP_045464643.1 intracellular protein transport protein USO1 [Harmonia axyridis]